MTDDGNPLDAAARAAEGGGVMDYDALYRAIAVILAFISATISTYRSGFQAGYKKALQEMK